MADETNENKKDEIVYNAPVVDFDNKRSIQTSVGFTTGSLEKYQIVWPVPQIADGIETAEKECKARYDCDLQTLIDAGIRQFTTRPNYKDVGFYNVGDTGSDGKKLENDIGTKKNPQSSHPDFGLIKPEGHQAMQTLADGYKVGQRQVGAGVKAVAQRAKKAEEEVGMTLEEMTAKIKQLKEQGLLDE